MKYALSKSALTDTILIRIARYRAGLCEHDNAKQSVTFRLCGACKFADMVVNIRCSRDMTDRISEFVEYIEETGAASNTRDAYERDIKLLIRQLELDGVRELQDISSAELMQYIDELQAKGRSAATISRTVASIRRFFTFTHGRGYTFSDPSELLTTPKVIKKTPTILSEKEVKRIIASVDTDTPKGLRDKAMLELIMSTGISVSEIIELKRADVDLKSQTINVGNKRRINISKKTTDSLRAYTEVRDKLLNGHEDSEVFFLSYAGRKMSRQGLWKIIRACGANAGIDNITPQMLRHSFAVSALRHGKDAVSIQRMLGHTTKVGVTEYQNLAAAES